MSGLPSWARVGTKVVCIDDSCRPGRMWMSNTLIVKGEIYTVDGVAPSADWDGNPAILLRECPNSTFGVGDDGWRVDRFRPLITLEDDLEAHFRQHLDVREPVGA